MLRIRKTATASFVVIAAALLAASGLRAGPPAEKAVVTVKGMACPFCAYGLEKSLKNLDGVTGVEVDVGKSEATLELDEGSAPRDEEIRRAVREAGFTAGEIRREEIAKARGETEGAVRGQFRVEGMRCEYCVANVDSILERRDGVISADVDLEAKRAVVEYDPAKITPEQIAETIEQAGEFEASVVSGDVPGPTEE